MRRVPVVPTIVVALAVAAMIALGLWQLLDRLPRKEAFLAQLQANPAKSAIAFPRVSDDRLLFRRAAGICAPPIRQTLQGAGAAGYRVIATCGARGANAGMTVQIGTTRDPRFSSAWTGGAVTGFISHAPSSQPLIATLLRHEATPLMLIADRPGPGLAANGKPDLSAVPNNHLAYAWQWFFFAGVASVIYVLALRRRLGR